ncbi:MAG: PD40 domain-containing protein, partial [Solirubrobacterales bacterium]|nr:PD40 domain-containing protein [Solirubrobacterales bacterium]
RAHVLAHADLSGRVVVRDVDANRVLWRSRPHLPPRALTWSSDGRRLLAIAREKTYLFSGASGGLLRHGHGGRNVAAAFRPGGEQYALVRRDHRTAESRIILVGGGRERFLFGTPGPTHGLAWSPDGRWLAVGAQRARAIVLLRPGPDGLASARSVPSPGGRLAGWAR